MGGCRNRFKNYKWLIIRYLAHQTITWQQPYFNSMIEIKTNSIYNRAISNMTFHSSSQINNQKTMYRVATRFWCKINLQKLVSIILFRKAKTSIYRWLIGKINRVNINLWRMSVAPIKHNLILYRRRSSIIITSLHPVPNSCPLTIR